MYLRKVLGK